MNNATLHSLVVALALVALAACASGPTTSPRPESTSAVPPKITPFSSAVVATPGFPRIASKGGCEPIYKNGSKGACVANQPCRGYGVRDDRGEDLCMCYLAKTGCDAKSRCDLPAHGCVPDDESQDDGD